MGVPGTRHWDLTSTGENCTVPRIDLVLQTQVESAQLASKRVPKASRLPARIAIKQ